MDTLSSLLAIGVAFLCVVTGYVGWIARGVYENCKR